MLDSIRSIKNGSIKNPPLAKVAYMRAICSGEAYPLPSARDSFCGSCSCLNPKCKAVSVMLGMPIDLARRIEIKFLDLRNAVRILVGP